MGNFLFLVFFVRRRKYSSARNDLGKEDNLANEANHHLSPFLYPQHLRSQPLPPFFLSVKKYDSEERTPVERTRGGGTRCMISMEGIHFLFYEGELGNVQGRVGSEAPRVRLAQNASAESTLASQGFAQPAVYFLASRELRQRAWGTGDREREAERARAKGGGGRAAQRTSKCGQTTLIFLSAVAMYRESGNSLDVCVLWVFYLSVGFAAVSRVACTWEEKEREIYTREEVHTHGTRSWSRVWSALGSRLNTFVHNGSAA